MITFDLLTTNPTQGTPKPEYHLPLCRRANPRRVDGAPAARYKCRHCGQWHDATALAEVLRLTRFIPSAFSAAKPIRRKRPNSPVNTPRGITTAPKPLQSVCSGNAAKCNGTPPEASK